MSNQWIYLNNIIPLEKYMDKSIECKLIKIEEDKARAVNELVVAEYPLTIVLNKRKIATLLCTPENLKCLAIGFLRTERLIKGIEDIISFKLDENTGIAEIETDKKGITAEEYHSKKVDLKNLEGVNSGSFGDFFKAVNCEPVDSDIILAFHKVYEFIKQDLSHSNVFKETGGVHCIALCDTENVLFMKEDVARHNALDKVIGEALINNICLKDKIVVFSGRVSLEMVLKAAKMQIPIIIAKGAPTNLGIELAKKLNITLIAFARGKKMNIYSNEQRIKY